LVPLVIIVMPYKPIENYGIIGDMRTVALVGLDGSIDFFCFPEFDSPSVFAAMLDDKKGGFFRIGPDWKHTRPSQLYVPDTNVLLTRSMADEGILEIADFMPINDVDSPSRIIRQVTAVRGQVPVVMECMPAFDYGRDPHDFEIVDGGSRALIGTRAKQKMSLHATTRLEGHDGSIRSRFTLKEGEAAFFMLCCDSEEVQDFDADCIRKIHDKTIDYWRNWVAGITYKGRWRDTVNRSALTLKLLTSRKHGSIIAAPTFSLPEAIGGRRNWDYRYCWMRDAAFTVYAMMRLGLRDEAIAFMKWVETLYKKAGDKGELQLMYRIDGSTDLEETTLDHFEGYRGSKPVRVGNEAYCQFQLDIYGELLDAVALADKHITKISYDAWQDVIRTADYVCENWRKPDAGIWEFRGEQREFLHSRLMCWVALDRALRMARDESMPAEFKRWLDTRAEIYNDIFENFWSDELQSFVQHKNAKTVDASVLLMPLVNFIGSHDPRWLSTLKCVGARLARDTLVHRYNVGEIDLTPVDSSNEGSFNACSFWYIACLARAGRQAEAWLLFSKMNGYANHLGLFAEETAGDGAQLGNFPQAFTHLAQINAVFALEESYNVERAETA